HPVVAGLPSHLGEPRQYDRQEVKVALHHTGVESYGESGVAFEPCEVSAQDRASTELALFAMGAAQMRVRGGQVAFRKRSLRKLAVVVRDCARLLGQADGTQPLVRRSGQRPVALDLVDPDQ